MSLSLSVARRTREVSCERAKDLIGCQKVEAGEVGLEGAAVRWTRSGPLLEATREGTEPTVALRPRAAENREPFWLVFFSFRLCCCFFPLLTAYDSRLGIVEALLWIYIRWNYQKKNRLCLKHKSLERLQTPSSDWQHPKESKQHKTKPSVFPQQRSANQIRAA